MLLWVLYDIENDRARTRVSKLCLQAGLYRVQYSCFLGTIEPDRKDALQLQVQELIDESVDRVYMFPMSKDQLQQTVLLGQAFDQKLMTDQIRALFF